VTHLGYLLCGWGSALVVLGAYAVSTIRRGRKLSEGVPRERVRWLTTSGDDA